MENLTKRRKLWMKSRRKIKNIFKVNKLLFNYLHNFKIYKFYIVLIIFDFFSFFII